MKFELIENLPLFEDITSDYSISIQESLSELNSLHYDNSLYETRNNTKYVKSDLLNKFISQNGIDFRGTEVTSIEDMAILAKIFRDTRYETTRIFFIKDGKIVSNEGVTSKITDTSAVLPKYNVERSEDKAFAIYKSKMNRLNADGYYLIHNHPSGVVNPSNSDIYVTKIFMKNLNGFLGHIIIGKDSYGIIDSNFKFNIYPYTEEMPIEENPITILNDETASKYAREYLNDKNYSVILYCNSQGNLISIQEIKNSELHDKNIGNYIANEKRDNGSVICILCTMDISIVDNENIQDALFRNILANVVIINGNKIQSMRDLVYIPIDRMYNALGKKHVNTYRVRED